jgi:hypothetical protein
MKKNVLLIFFSSAFLFCHAQDVAKTKGAEKEWIFKNVEEPPLFPGGDSAMYQFVEANFKLSEKGCGWMFATVTIDDEGRIIDQGMLKEAEPRCSDELIRVIKMMPRFKPARDHGKAVKYQYNMSVQLSH